jgi:hypothetical protein
MQFQVPQFIDIEDKVIGPFTIKQFMYLAGAGLIVFILYKILNIMVVIVLAIPIVVIALALGFYKPNNQPFIVLVKSFFGFLRKPDFYIWKKTSEREKQQKPETENIQLIKKSLDSRSGQGNPQAKENLQEIGWKVEIEK